MRTVYEAWLRQHPAARYTRLGTWPDLTAAQVALGASQDTTWRPVDNRLLPDGPLDEGPASGFVSIEQAPDTAEDRAALALDLIREYRSIDGGHHQLWLTDQITQLLAGDGYAEFVRNACNGEDGPDTYDWDPGIAP